MHEIRFRAMGTDCQVLAHAPAGAGDALAALAQERVGLLEQCWSRFRADSELSLLNAAAGRGPQAVSGDLLLLVERMQDAWRETDGLFDPTVLSSMTALGYDADFPTVAARPASSMTDVLLAAAPGMSGVRVDALSSTVELPAGIGIDPGAIGKGLAADVIVEELMGAGATGVLVNLGGDLSIGGLDDDPWLIGIEDERLPANHEDRVLRSLEFAPDATRIGVATSTTLKRRWAQGRRHHVIDPRTGDVATSDVVQVTVVESQAWRAEVLATAALLRPAADALPYLRDRDVTAFVLTTDHEYSTDDHAFATEDING